ncbi:metalloregulator ArsR/SmtB family transcription factor [Corynebacterium sp. TAE3-ERU12]|uniref:ArsR/SmtB family transcription factor n=1 Tax=Corynebacterium sp. TAE3-ERU12 TaxID=2849491 RepID=UPI001C48C609|nr:metalloregulator ArsR/SmtB family transcription factor [Corynebacterium sp. TAE3-ERU12]MBV7295495.1 metalloregulator ArsR/SmtB family transcription factor [Corynebacterium sp. TAE3-ERU12]
MSIALPTVHLEALSRFGHALSDPVRTRILLELKEASRYPSELADDMGVSRQVMSNHLACLRGCGLVNRVADGRRTRYSLSDPHLAEALDALLAVTVRTDPVCCGGEECSC